MNSHSNQLARLAVIPAVIYVGMFCLFPLSTMVGASLGFPDFDPGAYTRVFSEPAYLVTGERTFLFSLEVTVITFLLGYPLAAFLSQQADRGREYLVVLVAIPYLTSLLVRLYAWILLLGDSGIINAVLVSTGMADTPMPLLFNRIGALVGTIHVTLPLMVLPIYSVMRRVDKNLMRAALTLGSTELRAFLHVYLPQTLPGIASGVTLVFVLVLGFYVIPAALGGERETMLSNLIFNIIQFSQDFATASALSLVLVVTTLAVYLLLNSRVGGPSLAQSSARRFLRQAIDDVRMFLSIDYLIGRAWKRRLGRETRGMALWRVALAALGICVLAFLVLPNVVVVLMSFSDADVVIFPPEEYSLRWYKNVLANETWIAAFLLSMKLGVVCAVAALTVGALAGYGLVRGSGRERKLVMAIVLTPMIVPSVVQGVGLFGVFADWGILGTDVALLLAHTVSAIPYAVLIMHATLQGVDPRLEMASLSLGASRLRTAAFVVAPLVSSGLAAAALFAFMTSFDEVVKSSFIAGVGNRTLPLKIWDNILFQTDPAIAAVSSLLLTFPLLALFVLRQRFVRGEGN